MFSNQLSRKKVQIYSICQSLCSKHSHHGGLEAINVNVELERDVPIGSWDWGSGLQHTPGCSSEDAELKGTVLHGTDLPLLEQTSLIQL